MNRRQLVAAVAILGSTMTGCGTQSSSSLEIKALKVGDGDKVYWTKSVMFTDIKSVDWKDTDWNHVEGGVLGYARERKGGTVEIVLAHQNGTTSTFKIGTAQVVGAIRGELRLP